MLGVYNHDRHKNMRITKEWRIWKPWKSWRTWKKLCSRRTRGKKTYTRMFHLPRHAGMEGAALEMQDSAGTLRVLLSFAVGGLLGDVFLHLLPEAWEKNTPKTVDAGHPSMYCGLWVLSGFLMFVIVEKLFTFETEAEDESASEPEVLENDAAAQAENEMENNNCIPLIEHNPKNGYSKRYAKTEYSKNIIETQPFLEKNNGYSQLLNGYKNDLISNGIAPVLMCNEFSNTLKRALSADDAANCLKKQTRGKHLSRAGPEKENLAARDVVAPVKNTVAKEKPKHITGYLNLVANIIDNFTHGLAVGGSFLVSFRLGALTTFAILIHEIPHEVGDFAILLRSGFNRWDAARAQILTASGGIFGAMSAVFFSSGEVGVKTNWILPFTAGGFLHIGLVTILPELLKESSPKESLKQLTALLLGIVVMAGLTVLCD